MKRLACAVVVPFVALAGLTVGALPARASAVALRTVVAFDPSANEFPEGLAADKAGNLEVGFAFTGEIRRIGADGAQRTLATLPVGQGLLLGLAVDGRGTVYAALGSFDPATHGVWKIGPDGRARRLAALDPTGLPNALAFDDRGNLFVSDSFLGPIWRIPRGSDQAELWALDYLLAGDPVNGIGFGANGVAFRDGALYVGNTDEGTVIRIPVRSDGFFRDPGGVGPEPATPRRRRTAVRYPRQSVRHNGRDRELPGSRESEPVRDDARHGR